MVKQRIITALILATILLMALFADNSIYWRAFITAVVAIGFWEWLRFCKLESTSYEIVAWALFGIACYVVQTGYIPLNATIYATCALWIILLAFTAFDWFSAIHNPIIKCLIGLVIIPVGASFVIELKLLLHGPLWVICYLVAVFAADIGAFFVGRKFGKTKLAPNISPGKSVEGLLGGIAFVLVLSVPVLYHYFPAPEATGILLTMVVTALISVGGDLFESKMKRHVGLKDSSAILPGHGGILDRIDSLLPAAPFFMLGLLLLGYVV